MKVRSFTLTLTLIAMFLIVALPLIADDDKYVETKRDHCISGSGSIVKGDDNHVRAKSICHATISAEEGWYWGAAQVLPYDDESMTL